MSIFWVKNSWKCCDVGLTLISWEKLSILFGWKIRENVVILDFLAVDNFDFTRKIVKKKIGVKNLWKCWGFVKMKFLDKNLTFRIVCSPREWAHTVNKRFIAWKTWIRFFSALMKIPFISEEIRDRFQLNIMTWQSS